MYLWRWDLVCKSSLIPLASSMGRFAFSLPPTPPHDLKVHSIKVIACRIKLKMSCLHKICDLWPHLKSREQHNQIGMECTIGGNCKGIGGSGTSPPQSWKSFPIFTALLHIVKIKWQLPSFLGFFFSKTFNYWCNPHIFCLPLHLPQSGLIHCASPFIWQEWVQLTV